MTRSEVVGIYLSAMATDLPVPVEQARAVAHRGLENDRYFHGKGTYSDKDPKGPGRELTLIEQAALDHVKEASGITLSGAESRRNILTKHVILDELIGHRFRIGEVWVEGIRPCPPCAHLDELTGKIVCKALTNRGGLRADILTDGVIHVGDEIVVTG